MDKDTEGLVVTSEGYERMNLWLHHIQESAWADLWAILRVNDKTLADELEVDSALAKTLREFCERLQHCMGPIGR